MLHVKVEFSECPSELFLITSRAGTRSTLLLIGVLLIALIIAVNNFNQIGGVTWDEKMQFERLIWQLESFVNYFRNIPSDRSYDSYGYIQKAPLLLFLEGGDFADPIKNSFSRLYTSASHILIATYSSLTLFILFGVSKICKFRNPWLASLLLIATPVFFGHSVFNIKDIPFAFYYSLYSFTLLLYLNSRKKNSISWKIAALISCAVLSSMKLTVLPVMILQFVIISAFRDWNNCREIHIFKLFLNSTFAFIFNIAFILLITPHAWHFGFGYLSNAMREFSNYSWPGCSTFDGICYGKYINTDEVTSPYWSAFRYYLDWISIKFTFLNFLGLASALLIFSVSIFTTYHRITSSKQSLRIRQVASIIMGMQLFLLPSAIFIANSVVYDALRHILFIFPPIAFFGSFAIHKIEDKKFNKNIKKIIFVLLVGFTLLNSIDTLALSPYQYTYLNEFSRSRHLEDDRTLIDYWGASLAELYSITRSKTNLWVNNGVSGMFLDLNNLSAKNENDKFRVSIKHRALGKRGVRKNIELTADPRDLMCDRTQVMREYPLTKQKVSMSSLYLCEK